MQSVEMKLKQASAILGVPPKELPNIRRAEAEATCARLLLLLKRSATGQGGGAT